jgi:hypothetical protein
MSEAGWNPRAFHKKDLFCTERTRGFALQESAADGGHQGVAAGLGDRVREDAVEVAAGVNAELGEYLGQVVLDRSGADE